MLNIRNNLCKGKPKREHFTKKKGSWKPKVPYNTKEEAEAYIKKYKKKDFAAYLCKECNKWHIGHVLSNPKNN